MLDAITATAIDDVFFKKYRRSIDSSFAFSAAFSAFSVFPTQSKIRRGFRYTGSIHKALWICLELGDTLFGGEDIDFFLIYSEKIGVALSASHHRTFTF